jgi:histidinol-phosphate phosphatase family protein
MAKAVFLDRDGVINEENKGSYILRTEDFVFCEGATEAIAQLASVFDYVLVVTNQRGIGRGLMTTQDLELIHQRLRAGVQAAGGRIDAVYFAPAADRDDAFRKPNTGMALQAKKQFPEIDFATSVMVGNNLSDMLFGKRMGMHTVYLHTTEEPVVLPHELIDEQFDSLHSWVASLSI